MSLALGGALNYLNEHDSEAFFVLARRTPRVLPQQCYRIASGRKCCSIATNRNAASTKKGQNLATNGD